MPGSSKCPNCQAPVSGADLGGLCPECVVQAAGLWLEAEAAPSGGGRGFAGYELLGEIARGGMGVVYRARQAGLDRTVALKMILGGHLAAPEDVRRFQAEAQAAAGLRHPNIVAIHEVGEHEGQHFFSMDYIEGRSLAMASRERPFTPEQAARCVQVIAGAVQYAHEHGVLHRDLKPSNVLLDAAEQPHVTDFGLARRIEGGGELTLTGQVLGTPGYMAPEQAAGQGERLGPGTDVYGLGAILYELLTGRPPFGAATVHETIQQVLSAEPVSPRLLNPSVPRDLETICLKCLEKEPGRRYASAQALGRDLGRHLNHEPIEAVPPSTVYRARKFVRRHRLGVAVAALVAVVMTAATVISLIFAVRAERERTAARSAERDARKRAAETAAVLDFVRDHVMAAARPEGENGGLGHEVTLRQAIVAAEPQIARLFAHQPKVEFEIRHALGETFMDLGDFTNAIGQFERTTVLAEALGGPTNSVALAEATYLAGAHLRAGNVAVAMRQFEQNIERRRQVGSTNDAELARAREGLASACSSAGQLERALELQSQVAAWHRANSSPSDRVSLRSRANLAGIHAKLGQNEAALRLFKEVMEGFLVLGGEDAPETITAMHNLAGAHISAGDLPEALSLAERALESSRKKWGTNSPHTLKSLNTIGRIHMRGQRAELAIPYFKEAYERHAARYGMEHPDTRTMMGNLASAYQYAGRAQEALPLHEQALALDTKVMGPDNADTLVSMNNLAETLKRLGRLGEALQMQESVLRGLRSAPLVNTNQLIATLENLILGYLETNRLDEAVALGGDLLALQPGQGRRDALLTARVVFNLGYACLRVDRWAEAERFLAAALTPRQRHEPGRSSVFTTQYYLGRALLGQQRFADAETLFLQAHGGLQQRQAESPTSARASSLAEIARWLGQLYESWGNPAQAEEWRRKAGETGAGPVR